jgi:hypothetical protein
MPKGLPLIGWLPRMEAEVSDSGVAAALTVSVGSGSGHFDDGKGGTGALFCSADALGTGDRRTPALRPTRRGPRGQGGCAGGALANRYRGPQKESAIY